MKSFNRIKIIDFLWSEPIDKFALKRMYCVEHFISNKKKL